MTLREAMRVLVAAPLLLAPASVAAKPPPQPFPVEAGAPREPGGLDAEILQSRCDLGVLAAPTAAAPFLVPPDDEYFTRLLPDTCSACAGNEGALLGVAKLSLFFSVPCALPVDVAIVGATGDPGCPLPDRARVLCAPVRYTLEPGAAGTATFTLPLPAACCIQETAFLAISFVDAGSCPDASLPALMIADACATCTSYNFFPADPVMREVCTFYEFPGNPAMWVEGTCCPTTPVLPASWGRLKTLYRE